MVQQQLGNGKCSVQSGRTETAGAVDINVADATGFSALDVHNTIICSSLAYSISLFCGFRTTQARLDTLPGLALCMFETFGRTGPPISGIAIL